MSAHLIADDTTTPTATDPATDPAIPGPAADAWLALSAAMTDAISDIADREDLIVTIAPGAGHGAPACFLPHHAAVEVDGSHLGIDPATAHPDDPRDRARYATAWGLLTHEAAHARHSTWTPTTSTPPVSTAPASTPPASTPPAVAPAVTAPAGTSPAVTSPAMMEAAMLLEETRIEAAQIRRRPDDRYWLRASATGLILADTIGTHPEEPDRNPDRVPPPLTAWAAAQAAALILARVDAGILTATETAAVTDAVTDALGAEGLTALHGLWTAALDVADDDGATMLDLARRWCHTLGQDPDSPPDSTIPSGTGDGTGDGTGGGGGSDAGDGGSADGPASRATLEKAIRKALAAVAAAVAGEPAPVPPMTPAAAAREAETTALTDAEEAALRVFGGSGHARTGRTRTAGTRPPTDAEQAAARALSRALTTAGRRDRTATTLTSPTPPGRLRMRGALAADAQRAAGAVPTAEPFTRTVRRTVPTPPLRLGIACDVSGSMSAVAAPVASAAWILARAAHLTPMTTTATVIFGTRVRAITRPGITPAAVTEFHATDGYEDITTAIDALDHTLGLSRPDAARLLVIVSDGAFDPDQTTTGQTRTDRLLAAGCSVLWLDAHGWCRPFRGTTVHRLTDPTTTAAAIGRAATAALRAAT